MVHPLHICLFCVGIKGENPTLIHCDGSVKNSCVSLNCPQVCCGNDQPHLGLVCNQNLGYEFRCHLGKVKILAEYSVKTPVCCASSFTVQRWSTSTAFWMSWTFVGERASSDLGQPVCGLSLQEAFWSTVKCWYHIRTCGGEKALPPQANSRFLRICLWAQPRCTPSFTFTAAQFWIAFPPDLFATNTIDSLSHTELCRKGIDRGLLINYRGQVNKVEMISWARFTQRDKGLHHRHAFSDTHSIANCVKSMWRKILLSPSCLFVRVIFGTISISSHTPLFPPILFVFVSCQCGFSLKKLTAKNSLVGKKKDLCTGNIFFASQLARIMTKSSSFASAI